jgi:membrane protease YdiL (CAAX protease family)
MWRLTAGIEVAVAVAVIALGLPLPALIITALAGISLWLRRQGLSTLGLRRTADAKRMALKAFGLAVVWTMVNFALTKPILEHLSGRRQDMSAFEGLRGNVTMLLGLLALVWTLAAFAEEVAFRGFLQARMVQVLGGTAYALPIAVIASSVLFGFLHTEYGLVGVAVSAVDAIFYSVVYYHYRTLWAAVLTHGFVDTIGLVSVFAVGPIYGLW